MGAYEHAHYIEEKALILLRA